MNLWHNLTYKNKYRVTLVILFLSIVIVYKLSVKNTITAYCSYREESSKFKAIQEEPGEIKILENKLNKIDEAINKYGNKSQDVRQAILEITSKFCSNNNITLKEYIKPIIKDTVNYQLETNVIVLEGPFNKLLRYVYFLETENKLGRIMSTKFFIRKDFIDKQSYLDLMVYIQNLKQKDEKK